MKIAIFLRDSVLKSFYSCCLHVNLNIILRLETQADRALSSPCIPAGLLAMLAFSLLRNLLLLFFSCDKKNLWTFFKCPADCEHGIFVGHFSWYCSFVFFSFSWLDAKKKKHRFRRDRHCQMKKVAEPKNAAAVDSAKAKTIKTDTSPDRIEAARTMHDLRPSVNPSTFTPILLTIIITIFKPTMRLIIARHWQSARCGKMGSCTLNTQIGTRTTNVERARHRADVEKKKWMTSFFSLRAGGGCEDLHSQCSLQHPHCNNKFTFVCAQRSFFE